MRAVILSNCTASCRPSRLVTYMVARPFLSFFPSCLVWGWCVVRAGSVKSVVGARRRHDGGMARALAPRRPRAKQANERAPAPAPPQPSPDLPAQLPAPAAVAVASTCRAGLLGGGDWWRRWWDDAPTMKKEGPATGLRPPARFGHNRLPPAAAATTHTACTHRRAANAMPPPLDRAAVANEPQTIVRRIIITRRSVVPAKVNKKK